MLKGCFFKVGQFQLRKDSLTLLTHSLNTFSYLKNLLLTSNASFEQCRLVLVVWRFSDHKCRHGNVYAAHCNATRKKTVIMSPLDATKASFIMGFIVFVSSRRYTASQYCKGLTFPSHFEVFGQSQCTG